MKCYRIYSRVVHQDLLEEQVERLEAGKAHNGTAGQSLHRGADPAELVALGTPKERLSILRKAFKATLEDPKFLAQAKKSKLIINYVSGEEIERIVDQILAISPKAKERLQFLIHTKKKKKS